MKRGTTTILSPSGPITYDVGILDTQDELQVGLMGCKYLAPGTGMLFLLGKPRHVRLWTKNVPISIDMICIDEHKKIFDIYEDKIPFDETRYYPATQMFAMLEVNAGQSRKNKFDIGQSVDWYINPLAPIEALKSFLDSSSL